MLRQGVVGALKDASRTGAVAFAFDAEIQLVKSGDSTQSVDAGAREGPASGPVDMASMSVESSGASLAGTSLLDALSAEELQYCSQVLVWGGQAQGSASALSQPRLRSLP